jgi:hypothetical protein
MTSTLSNEEKLNIVNQHIKSIDFSIYGLQLDLMESQAIDTPDPIQVSSTSGRIASANSRRAVLVEERDSLTAE